MLRPLLVLVCFGLASQSVAAGPTDAEFTIRVDIQAPSSDLRFVDLGRHEIPVTVSVVCKNWSAPMVLDAPTFDHEAKVSTSIDEEHMPTVEPDRSAEAIFFEPWQCAQQHEKDYQMFLWLTIPPGFPALVPINVTLEVKARDGLGEGVSSFETSAAIEGDVNIHSAGGGSSGGGATSVAMLSLRNRFNVDLEGMVMPAKTDVLTVEGLSFGPIPPWNDDPKVEFPVQVDPSIKESRKEYDFAVDVVVWPAGRPDLVLRNQTLQFSVLPWPYYNDPGETPAPESFLLLLGLFLVVAIMHGQRRRDGQR